jgi:hypothetical protein
MLRDGHRVGAESSPLLSATLSRKAGHRKNRPSISVQLLMPDRALAAA